jgi:hypothetical protein
LLELLDEALQYRSFQSAKKMQLFERMPTL